MRASRILLLHVFSSHLPLGMIFHFDNNFMPTGWEAIIKNEREARFTRTIRCQETTILIIHGCKQTSTCSMTVQRSHIQCKYLCHPYITRSARRINMPAFQRFCRHYDGRRSYDCIKEGINVHAFNIPICYTYSTWVALFTRSPNDRQFPDCVGWMNG